MHNCYFVARLGILISVISITSQAFAADKQARAAMASPSDNRAILNSTIAEWPNRPQLAVQQMLAKYGLPQEISAERVIWNNQGPYLRIMVTKEEIPHDFPKPHMDFLEHTISYNVPVDKSQELIEFDGSSTINRTAGELSARCDLEGHNNLTLNLDHDIVTGKKDVEEARIAFAEIIVQDILGNHPPYVEALQFQPEAQTARFADTPVIPGSSVRASSTSREGSKDAEVLSFLIALDENEILAAMEATKKGIRPEVLEYAKMLHKAHGEHAAETMKLGKELDVVPLDTTAVEQFKVKGAGELAALVPLDAVAFEKAYLAAMVKGHSEAVAMIDNQLMKSSEDERLKNHLVKTRTHIVEHLEAAKKLQGGVS